MVNEIWPVDLWDLDKRIKWIENLSKEEIQKIVAEKFEYFSSLIKYSKNRWLQMKAYKASKWKEWTFACWLGEEWNKVFQQFMEWKIKFEDIPVEYFEPKYLYYWLPWLLTKNNDVLWPIVDHELEHAESTNYGDVVRNSREALLHNFSVTYVAMFMNIFEDIYMWKKQIAKWNAKKMWVLNLYRDLWETDWRKNMRKQLKIDQFWALAMYHWLKTEFPDDFTIKLKVDQDVREEFEKFLPHLDEIVDTDIENEERIKKKNAILWPIIDLLGKKDMEELKKKQIRDEIERERQKQQKWKGQKSDKGRQNEWEWEWENGQPNNEWWDNWQQSNEQRNSEQWNNGEWNENWKSEWNSWQQNNESWNEWEWDNWQENNESWNNNGWNDSEQDTEHSDNEEWSNGKWNENWNWEWDDTQWNDDIEFYDDEPWNNWKWKNSRWKNEQGNGWKNGKEKWNDTDEWDNWEWSEDDFEDSIWDSWNWDTNDPELEKEVQRRLDEMSEEELKKMAEKIKEEIDKKNLEEHWKDLGVQKKLLEKSETIRDKIKDLFNKEKRQQKKEENEEEEQQQKMQDQWDEIQDMVEKREESLEQEAEVKKALDEIEENTHDKNLKRMERMQQILDELEKWTENIDTEDIKKRLKEKIENMKDYIKQMERQYEKEIHRSGFSREEENLYKRYLKIEKEMSKLLDRFIKQLESVIPKLKEFDLESWYSSGRVTDMNDAGKKIRLKQFWEKLYSRYEEKESLEINLWICLSIDNSWSMDSNIEETIKLVVFLWLLCQKWWILFHVNTFGDHLNIIKDTDDDFNSRKGKLMRELDANGWCTNMWVAVRKDLMVLDEVKKTHPDTVFLPIFITDWYANEWITWRTLVKLIEWFKWLSMMVGIGINESQLKGWYPDSKVIWLHDSWEIMSKLLRSLKEFFKQNKSKIFKITTE